MRVLIEYEDKTFNLVTGLKAYRINEINENHRLLDEFLSDPDIKYIYIMANDNIIEGIYD